MDAVWIYNRNFVHYFFFRHRDDWIIFQPDAITLWTT